MRIIHLCFQLHARYQLREFSDQAEKSADYFDSKALFAEANQSTYQPLLALLERNVQKFSNLRLSLIVSGTWLELAERYNPELIERLRKLIITKHLELVIEPYYHSLAFFYNTEEMLAQTEQYQAKIKQLFKAESKILALPELMYNDAIGKWAEEHSFAGVLVGGSARALDWHSPNLVYEAAGCRYLRLLFNNSHLSELITQADPKLLEERKSKDDENASETTKLVLSATKFRKLLELDMLRGSLVNLYFDAKIITERRQDGIIGFFDELIKTWLENSSNRFVTASEACTTMTPTEEISIHETVSLQAERKLKSSPSDAKSVLPVLFSEIDCTLPQNWRNKRQTEAMKELYALRKEVLASEDEQLIADFRRLTSSDHYQKLTEKQLSNLELVLHDLKTRANEVKKSQAVKISRTYTKRHERNLEVPASDDSNLVKVQFGNSKQAASATEAEPAPKVKVSTSSEHVASKKSPNNEPKTARDYEKSGLPPLQRQNLQPIQEAEIIIDGVRSVPKQKKTKEKSTEPSGFRKIIRKLVIE